MTDATDIARQRRLLTVVIAGVVVGDQLVKWWTWRHVDGVLINSGGYILLGSDIRAWFATPVGGAVADVVGTVALIIAVGAVLLGYTIVRRRWIGERRDRNPPGRVPSVRARIVVMIVLLAVIALAVTSAMDHEGVHAPIGAAKYSQAVLIRR